MAKTYLAHSAGPFGKEDPVRAHLAKVAERAAGFAGFFGAGEEARTAGLLHDFGKYGELFQLRLAGKAKGVDHWSAGAWEALARFRNQGVASALAIAGHHTGLGRASKDFLGGLNPEKLKAGHPLGLKLSEDGQEKLGERFRADGLSFPALEKSLFSFSDANAASAMVDVRMLFSTLTDADFIETELHFQDAPPGSVIRPEGLALDAARDLEALKEFIARKAAASTADPKVAGLRNDLFAACLKASESPPGLFTLTAPTGSGKTCAMLAFALAHAARHGLRRLIMVIPYLNIIEQTVKEYLRIYEPLIEPETASRYLLEDHSMAGAGGGGLIRNKDEPAAEDLLAENWDAPLVVTTSVQFLESLFANRPAACRKLHRLAGSVILLDEVQTLPSGLAVPTLAALSSLAGKYGASVVFSTATQPAFDTLDSEVKKLCHGGWKPREIVPPGLSLFSRARRTSAAWPEAGSGLSWPELAGEIAALEEGRVLVIVNLKRHAQDLYAELESRDVAGLFHISTNLCPAHRNEILCDVRERLSAGKPCVLVATQCVEAGVDLDFPAVYRAFGPLDAIAQAAGRCNRNGRLKEGLVRIFVPRDEGFPDKGYERAAGVGKMLLESAGRDGLDLDAPETFTRYFKELYDFSRPGEQNKALRDAIERMDFEETARRYRVISKDGINILIPHDPRAFDHLVREAREHGLSRPWMEKARPHSVGIFRPAPGHDAWHALEPVMVGRHGLREESRDWFILRGDHYHRSLGLVLPRAMDCLIG